MRNHKSWALLVSVIRYGVVGVLNNLWGYLLYLAVTWSWLEPKVAVAVLYPVGALSAYLSHAKFSFGYQGHKTGALCRFIIAHTVGYVINLGLQYLFVDVMGYPHQLVQVVAIFLVAGVLFVLFRYYVFPQETSAELFKAEEVN